MRAFILIQKAPLESSESPQVIGVVVERHGKLEARFECELARLDLLPVLHDVHRAAGQLSGMHIEGRSRACMCWQVPFQYHEAIEALFAKWIGPATFF